MSDDEQPVLPEWSASSPDGSITVRTTELGLPRGISIESAKLGGDPDALAAQVLRLCRQSADRAGLARREQLEAAGLRGDMLALLGLPTPEEVYSRDVAQEEEYDVEPRSWLREV
ncbi:hypothetical protein [Nocardia noduli]|uniref:hypothetical protein n=1 Tax=Nocardia noduli TaxID=2815722 RepID=UPI001C21F4C0|nr:hypothetical protein [Nocardia noduli]